MDKFDMKKDSIAEITSYIYKAVHSCYMDLLKALGFNVRLSAKQAEQTGNKYVNIVNTGFKDVTPSDTRLHIEETPEDYAFHKQAYTWIENCFKSALTSVKDTGRANFYYAAFWEFEQYALNLKELALRLGYKSSNPTQELSRFVAKVTLCTSPHGIEIVNPSEQVQFIREQLIKHEAIHE
jgi:hypothetical protein